MVGNTLQNYRKSIPYIMHSFKICRVFLMPKLVDKIKEEIVYVLDIDYRVTTLVLFSFAVNCSSERE